VITFSVPGLSCEHCVSAITKALKRVDGAAKVDIDLAAKIVRVQSSQATNVLAKAIKAAGYAASKVSAG
jgi:copper chaperone